ncbi:hypothetical protein [Streptomyces sp. NBC_01190]|uniref:hypothetical protein n=1 Tax=Streptomyces sp. NBC_01190 TaxID=2903767 RepID=UPI0038699A3B|nr:hypothetical protein OG519_03230 [Streptomyces sp. NBC_01190]
MSNGVGEGQECLRCAELEARFKDPVTPNPGAFLYGWATHQLDDHGARPGPRAGCAECARYAADGGAIQPRVWLRWARTHYMSCALAPGWKPAGVLPPAAS